MWIVQQGRYDSTKIIGVFDDLGRVCAMFGILPDQLEEVLKSPLQYYYGRDDEQDGIDYRAIRITQASLNVPIREYEQCVSWGIDKGIAP